jgi:hypothetical protein
MAVSQMALKTFGCEFQPNLMNKIRQNAPIRTSDRASFRRVHRAGRELSNGN